MTKCKVESKRARTESGPNEPLERSSDSESESYSEFDSDEAFTVIRLPAGQTSRDASGVETSSQAADQEDEATLYTYLPLFEGETRQQRLARRAAFEACWGWMDDRFKAVEDAAFAATSIRLREYVDEQLVKLRKKQEIFRTTGSRYRLLPAALAVSGTLNPADLAETLPALAEKFRQQGCYVAYLQPKELEGIPIAPALNCILRGFSGIDTPACSMLALHTWYEQEMQKAKSKTRTKEEQIMSPFKRLDLLPNQRQTRSSAAVAAPHQEHDLPAKEAATGCGSIPAAKKPLVVFVEDTEDVNKEALQNLISVLSENLPDLPVVVVLGLTLGHWKLNEMLPPRLTDKLVMRTFPLARGLERMDAFFETALLSDDCGLCLGHAMLCDLDHTFLAHDFTFRSFINALKVACSSHCRSNPLSFLAAVPEKQQADTCLSLPQKLKGLALKALELKASSSQAKIREAVSKGTIGVAAWKLALLFIHTIGQGVGYIGLTCGLSLRELYRDACAPKYSQSKVGKDIFQALHNKIGAANAYKACGLLQKLLKVAEGRLGALKFKEEICAAKACNDASNDSGQQAQAALLQLLKAAIAAMDTPPCTFPGTKGWIVRDEKKTRDGHSMDISAVLHEALAYPERFLGGPKLGLSPQQNDTANVYQLLLEYPETVDVDEWFSDFCAIYEAPSSKTDPQSPTAKPKSKTTLQKRGRKAQEKPPPALSCEELVARFTQATNELQVMGIIEHSNSSEDAKVKRLMWPFE